MLLPGVFSCTEARPNAPVVRH